MIPPLDGGGGGAAGGAGVGFGEGAGFCPTPGAYAPLLSLPLLLPESVVVVGLYDDEHEELLEELLLQELELDDAVCSPWYAVSDGRLEGTWKSGQLLPWADSMKERQIGPDVGPPNPV